MREHPIDSAQASQAGNMVWSSAKSPAASQMWHVRPSGCWWTSVTATDRAPGQS